MLWFLPLCVTEILMEKKTAKSLIKEIKGQTATNWSTRINHNE